MINELFYILYVFQVFQTWHVFYTWSTSPLRSLPFQVLRSLLLTHMGPSGAFSPCHLAPACFSSPTVSLCRTHTPGPLLCKFWSRWGEDVAEAGEPGPCDEIAQHRAVFILTSYASVRAQEWSLALLLGVSVFGSSKAVSGDTDGFWESEGNKIEKHWSSWYVVSFSSGENWLPTTHWGSVASGSMS